MKMKVSCIVLIIAGSLFTKVIHATEVPVVSIKDSVSILLEFSRKNITLKPLMAEKLAHRALGYAQKEKFVRGEAQAALVLGQIYSHQNRPQQAIDSYLLAAQQFNKSGDKVEEGISYNGIASVYIYKLNHYTKAYQYCNLALPLMKSDSAKMQSVFTNLAALHVQTHKLDEALTIYTSVYEYWKRHNNLSSMATALNNIATVYDGKRDYNSSIAFYEKSLEINRLLNDPKNTAHVMIGLAPVYMEVKRYQDAHELLQQAVELSASYSLHTTHVVSLQYLSCLENTQGNITKALTFALEAQVLVNQHQLALQKEGITMQLSELYTKKGDLALALQYQKKLSALRDSSAQQERLAVTGLITEKEPVIFTTFSSALPQGSYIFWIIGLIFLGVVGIVTFKTRKLENAKKPIDTSTDEPSSLKSIEDTTGTLPLNSRTTMDQHLEVIHGRGVKLVSLKSILWFQKEGKNYHAITEQDNYRVNHTISELEETLPASSFFRINRAVIINIDYMDNYSFWENHKYILRMRDTKKTEFIISRNRLRELKETFQLIDIS